MHLEHHLACTCTLKDNHGDFWLSWDEQAWACPLHSQCVLPWTSASWWRGHVVDADWNWPSCFCRPLHQFLWQRLKCEILALTMMVWWESKAMDFVNFNDHHAKRCTATLENAKAADDKDFLVHCARKKAHGQYSILLHLRDWSCHSQLHQGR